MAASIILAEIVVLGISTTCLQRNPWYYLLMWPSCINLVLAIGSISCMMMETFQLVS